MSIAWIAYAVLLLLLLLCAVHGLRATTGLAFPPDLDALRDIGFAQGMLDHNWFGDPEYGDTARYYPPLVPALGALAASLFGGDLPGFWTAVGPWVNLLVPFTFFLAIRRLFASDAVAATATAVVVLFNGAVIVPWLSGGYTPWLLSPLLAQAGFFASLALIHARLPAARWSDAVWIGLAIGLTFLAHIIPALLLTCMLVTAAFVVHGPRWRTVGWLGLAGGVQTILMALYAVPILLRYPGGIVNQIPGAWTPGLLQPEPNALLHLFVVNAPGLIAAIATLWLRRAVPVAPMTWAMLLACVGVCLAFLLRHEACGLMPSLDASAACHVLRMPAHHFHLYLQLAWAAFIGYALWHGAARWAATPARRRMALTAGLLVFAAGAALMPFRKYDNAARAGALSQGGDAPIDMAAYHWILAHTGPDATFVTGTVDNLDVGDDQAAFTVMAAGRRLAAAGPFFSNPYVDWTKRDARRRQLLASVTGGACAAPEASTWALLPVRTTTDPARAKATFSSENLAVYELLACE